MKTKSIANKNIIKNKNNSLTNKFVNLNKKSPLKKKNLMLKNGSSVSGKKDKRLNKLYTTFGSNLLYDPFFSLNFKKKGFLKLLKKKKIKKVKSAFYKQKEMSQSVLQNVSLVNKEYRQELLCLHRTKNKRYKNIFSRRFNGFVDFGNFYFDRNWDFACKPDYFLSTRNFKYPIYFYLSHLKKQKSILHNFSLFNYTEEQLFNCTNKELFSIIKKFVPIDDHYLFHYGKVKPSLSLFDFVKDNNLKTKIFKIADSFFAYSLNKFKDKPESLKFFIKSRSLAFLNSSKYSLNFFFRLKTLQFFRIPKLLSDVFLLGTRFTKKGFRSKAVKFPFRGLKNIKKIFNFLKITGISLDDYLTLSWFKSYLEHLILNNYYSKKFIYNNFVLLYKKYHIKSLQKRLLFRKKFERLGLKFFFDKYFTKYCIILFKRFLKLVNKNNLNTNNLSILSNFHLFGSNFNCSNINYLSRQFVLKNIFKERVSPFSKKKNHVLTVLNEFLDFFPKSDISIKEGNLFNDLVDVYYPDNNKINTFVLDNRDDGIEKYVSRQKRKNRHNFLFKSISRIHYRLNKKSFLKNNFFCSNFIKPKKNKSLLYNKYNRNLDYLLRESYNTTSLDSFNKLKLLKLLLFNLSQVIVFTFKNNIESNYYFKKKWYTFPELVNYRRLFLLKEKKTIYKNNRLFLQLQYKKGFFSYLKRSQYLHMLKALSNRKYKKNVRFFRLSKKNKKLFRIFGSKRKYLKLKRLDRTSLLVFLNYFINLLSVKGRRKKAYKILYDFLFLLKEKYKDKSNFFFLFYKVISEIRPLLYFRTISISGKHYKVPVILSRTKGLKLAIKWLATVPRTGKKNFVISLFQEFNDVLDGSGELLKKRNDLHSLALEGRPYLRFLRFFNKKNVGRKRL